MSEELKYCKFCDKEKPIKEFCKSGSFIKNICRECWNKKQKERYKNSKLVDEKDKEIERLNNIINNGKNKVQEVKEHLDKSGFDGMTKSILIMALNEIIYSLNGDDSNECKRIIYTSIK